MLSFSHADLIAAEPCDSAEEYWKQYGKSKTYSYQDILERCRHSDFFWCCQLSPKALKVAIQLAIFAAKLMQTENSYMAAAIEAAERCLADPSEENIQAADSAAAAADTRRWAAITDVTADAAAAAAADAARAASWAADAARAAAWAADAAVRARARASTAATWASRAASWADTDLLKTEARRLLLEAQ